MSLTILTADELQNLEMRAANQLGADTLMKRAGAAAAELIMKRLEDAGVEQRRVTLLVGPGNNGGDALACACELREKGERGAPGRPPPDLRPRTRPARTLDAGRRHDL